jgi:hypothetical protein
MKLASLVLVFVLVAACGGAEPRVRLTNDWPMVVRDYGDVVWDWTRRGVLRGEYQEVLQLAATFKSPEWRAAHAARNASVRELSGDARAQRMQQAQADAAGPYEIELLVTTWDRRENDLDRGKHSVWRVTLLDEQGREIEPLEIIKDKRPTSQIKAEFPAFHDFATAYIARYPRTAPVLGPGVRKIHLRMSSERGGVSLFWDGR